jgi:molecular chaperone DnaK
MDRIRSAMETLTKASHRLAEVMYKQARERQAPGGQPGPQAGSGDGQTQQSGPTGPAEGEVVDAEFEDLGKK